MARLYYKWSEDSKELLWNELSESGEPINSGTVSIDAPEVQSFLSTGKQIIMLEMGEPADIEAPPAPSGLYPIVYHEDGTFTQTK